VNGTVLIIAETSEEGGLRDISYELVTAAAQLSGERALTTKLAVIAPESERSVISVVGVDEVLEVPVVGESFEPHVWQRAVEALVETERPDLVLVGHTIDALGFAPAVAARGGLGFSSDVQAIRYDDDGRLRAQRGAYAGKLTAELAFPDKECVLLMVREGAYDSTRAGSAPRASRRIDLDLADAARTERLELRPTALDEVDISEAPFVISIGRGVDRQEAVARLQDLADRWGAVLTCSRPLVDLGWMPPSRLVGQSASTVKPRIYLALGISGAPPHMAGVRGAETIIAVNLDPDAPIFLVAQYGAVVGLFDVVADLEAALA
jgi:electron transfer flavoprotein alpha subunit